MPPDAPQPPGKAATEDPGKEIRSKRTEHDPSRCATCLGRQPWTERRREEAESYAARSGRRIGDLQVAS